MKKLLTLIFITAYSLGICSCSSQTSSNKPSNSSNIFLLTFQKWKRPGGGKDDIDFVLGEQSHAKVIHENVFYITNADGSLTDKTEVKDGTILYGTYREEDIIKPTDSTSILYFLIGLYSFIPRII